MQSLWKEHSMMSLEYTWQTHSTQKRTVPDTSLEIGTKATLKKEKQLETGS